jgi:hypothetical protein
MNGLRLYHAVGGGRFPSVPNISENSTGFGRGNPNLSLPKVDSRSFDRRDSLRKVWYRDINLPKGSGLNFVVLESTFGRDRNFRTAIIGTDGFFQRAIEYSQPSDLSLRKPDCRNHGGGVGATQSISERPQKLAPGSPVVAGNYLCGEKSAAIFPMGYAMATTGRPGLDVKSTVYRIVGRPYQTNTKTKAQIRNLGNAYVGR